MDLITFLDSSHYGGLGEIIVTLREVILEFSQFVVNSSFGHKLEDCKLYIYYSGLIGFAP